MTGRLELFPHPQELQDWSGFPRQSLADFQYPAGTRFC
jgi:hypothetical protein